jgi:uncharacterized protein YjbJ (UPF0337 family)
MTTTPDGSLDPLGTPTDRPTDSAKREASNVKDAASGAAQQVTGTAKEQAGQVASDVREQTRQMADQTRTQLSTQVNDQRGKAVGGLRSVGDELRSMVDQGGQSGLATQLVSEGADLTHKAADFIEQREPAQLLDEIRSFARRKPGTFLLGSALAGIVVGRLTRGVVANRRDAQDSTGIPASQPIGYTEVTPSSYLGTPVDTAPVGETYADETPAYGTAQMDQLAYPAEGADYTPETPYVADSGAYLPEEPGPYDVAGEQPATTYPSEQGYRS